MKPSTKIHLDELAREYQTNESGNERENIVSEMGLYLSRLDDNYEEGYYYFMGLIHPQVPVHSQETKTFEMPSRLDAKRIQCVSQTLDSHLNKDKTPDTYSHPSDKEQRCQGCEGFT